MRQKQLLLFAVLWCCSTALAATIAETAASNETFSTLATALELTGLDDTLDCDYFFCQFTVFAPTNDAFDALGDVKEKLITSEWEEHLRRILLYHVAAGRYASDDIPSDGSILTLLFEKVNTTISGTEVKINDATVTIPDIDTSNGYIHAIDKVLIPSFMKMDLIAMAREAGNFGTLLAAVEAASLTLTLQGDGPFTLFAPTDRAFERLGQGTIDALLKDTALLGEILKYHVTSGILLSTEFEDGVSLDTLLDGARLDVSVYGFWFFKYPYLNENVRISFTDILTSNGVIHVIDSVLLPQNATPPQPAIAQILEADPTLETLTAALKAAELFDTFNADGSFTVFAPSEDAFAELGSDTIQALLADPEALQKILTYHVIGTEVVKVDLENGAVETLNGASVLVDTGFFRTKINNARVTHFDLQGSNGVVHIIDEVLLPPAGDCLKVAEANGLTEFVAAVDKVNLRETLTNPDARLTIFAPTNSAFEDISGVSIDEATLVDILKYHVLSVVAASSSLSDGEKLTTLQGGAIDVDFKYILFVFFLGVFLNDESKIVGWNLLCSNGIIHTIDKILTPS